MINPNQLTPKQIECIIANIREHAVADACCCESPEAEACQEFQMAYFGVIPSDGSFDVWSYSEDYDADLTHEGSFGSYEEAVARAKARAVETQTDADAWLVTQKDEAWASAPQSNAKLEGPFKYSDNTDFRNAPWVLETAEDVFDFFARHGHLFESNEPGSLFQASLTDANDVICWAEKSHRGEMRLVVSEFQDQDGVTPGVAQAS